MTPAEAAGIPGLIEEVPECGGFAVNPYSGCDIRCVYCITGMQGRSTPRASSSELRAALRRGLAASHRADRFALGAISDAYPSVDRSERRARIAVEELVRSGRTFSVVTKSTIVSRDADLLGAPGASVTVSLCSTDDAALVRLDPGAEPHEPRLQALRVLSDAGVPVSVSISPFIPGVTDVTAIRSAVDRIVGTHTWVVVSALNVRAPAVAHTWFGRTWEQAEINDAFLTARDESHIELCTSWLEPPPLASAATTCAFEGLPGSHSTHDATPVVLGTRLQPTL